MKPTCHKALRVSCTDCDWEGTEDKIGKTLCEIHHLWDRLTPGGTVPVGECPECGSFAYYSPGLDPVADAAPQLLTACKALLERAGADSLSRAAMEPEDLAAVEQAERAIALAEGAK